MSNVVDLDEKRNLTNEVSWCVDIRDRDIRWHLRPLTRRGRRPTGGIDSPSLCSKVVAPHGADVVAEVSEEKLATVGCEKCVKVYRLLFAPLPAEVKDKIETASGG